MANINFRKVLQLGTSLAICFPKEIATKLNINKGAYIKITDNNDGSLVLTPIKEDSDVQVSQDDKEPI
jgi:antitoxin component of MazEF toxin-antitoxin module